VTKAEVWIQTLVNHIFVWSQICQVMWLKGNVLGRNRRSYALTLDHMPPYTATTAPPEWREEKDKTQDQLALSISAPPKWTSIMTLPRVSPREHKLLRKGPASPLWNPSPLGAAWEARVMLSSSAP
jgi:hypothetical protein